MLSMSQLLIFIVGTFVIVVIPGPNILYLIARSIQQGRMAGLASVLGIEAATVVHICAATFGLSSLLLSSALAFNIVKYLGAAYLIYLGIRKIFDRSEEQVSELAVKGSLMQVFSQGFIVNLLNPKTAMFFLAFLPQFVNAGHGNAAQQILLLGIVLVVLATIIELIYVLLSSHLWSWFKGNHRFTKRKRYLAGSVYLGLGLSTAFSGSSHK